MRTVPTAVSRRLAPMGVCVLLVVGMAACSSGNSKLSSDSSTTVTTVGVDEPDTTAPGGSDTSEDDDHEAADDVSGGDVVDCGFVTSDDLRAVGIEGDITGGFSDSFGSSDDSDIKSCEFNLTVSGKATNLIVSYSAAGGEEQFEDSAAILPDHERKIDDLGDKAVYYWSDPDPDYDWGLTELRVVVLKGDSVLVVRVPSEMMVKESQLMDLARRLAAQI